MSNTPRVKLVDPQVLKELPVHWLASLPPMMSDDELDALGVQMREGEQIHPVSATEKQLIDGRNRIEAALRVGIKVKVRYFEEDEVDVERLILDENILRRRMSARQIAAMALEYQARLKQSGIKTSDTKLAKLFGVSKRTIVAVRAKQSKKPVSAANKKPKDPAADPAAKLMRAALLAAKELPDERIRQTLLTDIRRFAESIIKRTKETGKRFGELPSQVSSGKRDESGSRERLESAADDRRPGKPVFERESPALQRRPSERRIARVVRKHREISRKQQREQYRQQAFSRHESNHN